MSHETEVLEAICNLHRDVATKNDLKELGDRLFRAVEASEEDIWVLEGLAAQRAKILARLNAMVAGL